MSTQEYKFTCDSSVNPGRIIYYICGTKSKGGKIAKSFPVESPTQEILNKLKTQKKTIGSLTRELQELRTSSTQIPQQDISQEIKIREDMINKLIKEHSAIKDKISSLLKSTSTN